MSDFKATLDTPGPVTASGPSTRLSNLPSNSTALLKISKGDRCLVTTLAGELLDEIGRHLFAELEPVDEQLQRYRLAAVCRTFSEAYTKEHGFGVVEVDTNRALRLAHAIRAGRKGPSVLQLRIPYKRSGSEICQCQW